jgi:threonine dehydratase
MALVDDVVTVTEDEIGAAVAWTAREGRIVAEPSGAVSVAAALRDSEPERAVAVISGGNVDPALYAKLMTEGVVA